MSTNFFFWWSVVSTIISIILIGFSIWQYLKARYSEERGRAQVKIWMQDANGISQGLVRIVQDNLDNRYTSTNDMANSVWSLQSASFSLYQSLYEERCVTEEEFKQLQKELQEKVKKSQTVGASLSPSKPIEKKKPHN